MALAGFLVWNKKLSGGCFVFIAILCCVVLVVAESLVVNNEFNIAQLNDNTSRQNLLAEQEKTKQSRHSVIIKFLGFATPIVGYVIHLLRQIHFGH